MTETPTADDIIERFVGLAQLGRPTLRRANRDGSSDPGHLAEEGDARRPAVRYSVECIADELRKLVPSVFSPDMRARFVAVGGIVENHIDEGRDGIDQQRALIEKAEEFATFPLYHEHFNETDDHREIAERLIVAGVSAAISRFAMDRELPKRVLRPPKDLYDVDKAFTVEQARKLTAELGHLHQDVRTRLRTIDDLFADPSNDRVGGMPGNIRQEIASPCSRLRSETVDPTPARIDDDLQKERDRTQQAASGGSFVSSASPVRRWWLHRQGQPGTRRRRRDPISSGDGDASSPPARRRRLGIPDNSSKASPSNGRGGSEFKEQCN
ncbi:hypothetical protein ACCS93_36940 [Rhizobium ruizarguesonis]